MNLEDFKSKAHFKAPEGYFDNFEQNLLQRIQQKNSLARNNHVYHIVHRMIAAALALLLLFGAYNLRLLMNEAAQTPELVMSWETDSLNFIHEPLLSDAELVEIMIQPKPVKQNEKHIQLQEKSNQDQSFINDETLMEAGLIEFNDPALYEFGIL